MLTKTNNIKIFALFFISYIIIIFGLLSGSDNTLKNLHLGLETSNVILSLLLTLFLWDSIHATQQRGRRYLSVSFGLVAFIELLDAATDIGWSGWLAWLNQYAPVLERSSWSLSTYVLVIGLIWSAWLIRYKPTLSLRVFILGMGAVTVAVFWLLLLWPTRTDLGMLGMQQPTQIPLILLWVIVIVTYWHERRNYPLFEGLAMMSVLFGMATAAMLYSPAPYEHFSTIAYVGKLIGYGILNVTLMGKAVDDAQARTAAEISLFAEKQQLKVTLGSIGDGVITTDNNSKVTYLNPVAELMTGWASAEADGLTLNEIFRVVGERRNPVDINAASKSLAAFERSNAMLTRRDGVEFHIEESSAPIYTDDGSIGGMVLVFRDVTAIHTATAQLVHQATHDALTGLINRYELERYITGLFQGLGRTHVLLHLDLDQFKIINDTCGHIAGDELLRQVTKKISATIRSNDVLARLDGDEFAVLLPGCSLEQGQQVAEKIRLAISQFVFEWQGKVFNNSISLGLVNFSDTVHSNMDVMMAAETACYIAKDLGRNRSYVYREDDRDVLLRHGELAWIERIHRALREDRLRLYRQEIVLVSGEAEANRHYELLIRMLDEQNNVIGPAAFIPAAERYSLMPMLDRWVVLTAFAAYRKENHEIWSINLSGSSISDEQFLAFLKDQFKQFDVPPQAICFEITETAVITNLSSATYFIRELRALGCSFSLDDFGSGMSSFGYLKYLPVDYLKIDGGFVKDMEHDPIDCAMVEAINKIGQVMGLKTIAEFVENDAIRKQLHEMGVNYAQGYGIHKPEPF